MNISKPTYDVIIIGGGPAGATTAALVAQTGRSVLVLEREPVPPFKIGESLMPATYWTFQRLGVLEKLKNSPFVVKSSVQFYSKSGKASQPFYFFETNDHESSRTWQVLRSEFDELLLDNAREKGAEVAQGVRVTDIVRHGSGVTGVKIKTRDSEIGTISARVTVDASGQSALIARKLRICHGDLNLKKASIYTHFRGVSRADGIDAGATIILQTKEANSWFWFIPLPDDVVSIGVVGDIDYLLKNRNGDDYKKIFFDELALCPALQPKLARAEHIFPVKTTRDFSYRATQMAGDGWILVGDAYGFLDPIYSSGIFLALKSAELAADCIADAFDKNDFSANTLRRSEKLLNQGMEAIRHLVHAFYSRDFSFGKFLRAYPEHKRDIVDILVGNVFARDMKRFIASLNEMRSRPHA